MTPEQQAQFDQLMAMIPEGKEFTALRNTLSLIGEVFPDALNEIDARRLKGWVRELHEGTGRTGAEIRSDIFEHIVTAPVIQARLGVSLEEAEALIAGEQTFAETEIPEEPGGEAVGDAIIPPGGRLVKVRDPEGTNANFIYYITYEVNGMTWSFEVGDTARFEELFGSENNFDNKVTMSQAEFDEQQFVDAGSIDAQLGTEDSLQSQFEQDLRDLGLEDLPSWISGSEEAMLLIANASNQQWSSGRLWRELSETEAFSTRFGGAIDRYLEGGVTVEQAVNEYIADEADMRRVLRRFQPAGTEITTEYLNEIISNGWTARGAEQVLTAAQSLRARPNALADANAVLTQAGIGPINEIEFINAINGQGQAEVVEAINTASAAVALSEAGLEDVDVDLLLDVVDTSDRVLTVESFQQLSQQLAFNVIQNERELERGSFEISRDDLIAAAFGEESPSGKSSGEVLNLLARFERDRRAAAEGSGGFQGVQDNRGRLRLGGLSGL